MNVISYSPNGDLLASGGEDGKIKIWNVLNGQCVSTFLDHSGPITGL